MKMIERGRIESQFCKIYLNKLFIVAVVAYFIISKDTIITIELGFV